MIRSYSQNQTKFVFLTLFALLFIFISFVHASQEERDFVHASIQANGAHWLAEETSISLSAALELMETLHFSAIS